MGAFSDPAPGRIPKVARDLGRCLEVRSMPYTKAAQ